jgi:hypothetical protein
MRMPDSQRPPPVACATVDFVALSELDELLPAFPQRVRARAAASLQLVYFQRGRPAVAYTGSLQPVPLGHFVTRQATNTRSAYACSSWKEDGLNSCVRPLVASSRFTVLGFFQQEDAGAQRARVVYDQVASTLHHTWPVVGEDVAVGLVSEAPRLWLESAAIPDWIGIDCSFDAARWLVVVYHHRDTGDGELEHADIEVFFPRKQGILEYEEVTSFLRHRQVRVLERMSIGQVVANYQIPLVLLYRGRAASDHQVRAGERAIRRAAKTVRGLALFFACDSADSVAAAALSRQIKQEKEQRGEALETGVWAAVLDNRGWGAQTAGADVDWGLRVIGGWRDGGESPGFISEYAAATKVARELYRLFQDGLPPSAMPGVKADVRGLIGEEIVNLASWVEEEEALAAAEQELNYMI